MLVVEKYSQYFIEKPLQGTKKVVPLYSVVASAFLFGRCGEIACNFANEYTVTATEVIRAMPDAINSLFK